MTEIWGTLGGRWYITGFAIAYVFFGVRLIGWKRLAIYSVVAFVIAAACENGSVHWGIPFTRYDFASALRGKELFIFDVPLGVPLSYTFVMFFAFFAGRMIVAGPRRTVPRSPVAGYLVGVLLATWATWTLDPVSQRGDAFYLGDLFHYDGPGFWFGLPLGSQVGWLVVSAVLCGILAYMVRNDRNERPASLWRHPQLPPLLIYTVEVVHLSIVAIVIGEHTLGGAGLLIWIPLAAVVAALWPQLAALEDALAQSRPDLAGLGDAADPTSVTTVAKEVAAADGPAPLTHSQ